ncbi:hypothetical protein ACP6O1_002550 [Cronobacter dublinensis]
MNLFKTWGWEYAATLKYLLITGVTHWLLPSLEKRGFERKDEDLFMRWMDINRKNWLRFLKVTLLKIK